MTDGFVPNVSVVMPWGGQFPELYAEAKASIPKGTPLIVAQNGGKDEMALAINSALDAVQTDYVFIMAADDRIDEDTLRLLAEGIGTADVAYPPMQLFGEKDLYIEADVPSVWRLQDWNYISGCFLARTSLLRKVGWRDCTIEDWDFHLRAMLASAKYQHVPAATYYYRIHDKSLSYSIIEASAETQIGAEDVRGEIMHNATGKERVDLIATFYVSASEAQAWTRGVLPARYLPGAARRIQYDTKNAHQTGMSVWHHPGIDAEPLVEDEIKLGKRFVIDVDDNYQSPRLIQQLHDMKAPLLAELWEKNQPAHMRLIEKADAIICSTEVLADKYQKLNANTVCIPNTVDPIDWPTPQRIDDGKIRVGWAAGRQHTQDAPIIEGAMRWASEQPGVEVVMIGIDPGWDFEYRHVPFTPSLQVYRDVLSTLDIGFAPLRSSDFSDCVSDLKFLDYTMAGAVTIASNRPAYDSIRHGETGFIARKPRDFKRHLQEALSDPEATFNLWAKASEYVHANRLAQHARLSYLFVAAGLGVIELEEVEREPETAVA